MVKENNDNNNVMLKQVLDGLDKVDTKIDEKIYGKTEIKVKEEKEYTRFIIRLSSLFSTRTGHHQHTHKQTVLLYSQLWL